MPVSLHDIHGEVLRFRTESPAIAAAADELLADFAPGRDGAGTPMEMNIQAVMDRGAMPLQVSDTDVAIPVAPSARSYRIYRRGVCRLLDYPELALFCLDPRAERIDGWLVEPDRLKHGQIVDLLKINLIELLRLRGLNAVHAAAVERDGRGILIVGACGRGKTTSCLALIQAGYRCLSDDHPLLREHAGGLEMLPFLGPINVTDQTAAMFPDLREHPDRLQPVMGKRSFRLSAVFPDRAASPCQPNALIFPRIVDTPRSRLEPLPRARTLELLLPEVVRVDEPRQTRRQFEMLTRLVSEVPGYRLHFGRDIDRVAELFESRW